MLLLLLLKYKTTDKLVPSQRRLPPLRLGIAAQVTDVRRPFDQGQACRHPPGNQRVVCALTLLPRDQVVGSAMDQKRRHVGIAATRDVGARAHSADAVQCRLRRRISVLGGGGGGACVLSIGPGAVRQPVDDDRKGLSFPVDVQHDAAARVREDARVGQRLPGAYHPIVRHGRVLHGLEHVVLQAHVLSADRLDGRLPPRVLVIRRSVESQHGAWGRQPNFSSNITILFLQLMSFCHTKFKNELCMTQPKPQILLRSTYVPQMLSLPLLTFTPPSNPFRSIAETIISDLVLICKTHIREPLLDTCY